MIRGYLVLVIIINGFPYLTSGQCNAIEKDIVNRTEKIQSIAEYILQQLGLNQPPHKNNRTTNIATSEAEKRVTDYYILTQRHNKTKVHECDHNTESPDAKNISTIPGEPLNVQSASESGSGSDSKRASGDHSLSSEILVSYDIKFHINASTFNRPPHLVELMVYKKKSNCNFKNDYLLHDQLVEVIDKSNTSSFGMVIAAKLLDVCGPKGYISFDVTKAAVRWMEHRLKKIDLTLIVKCISSYNSQCDSYLASDYHIKFSTSGKDMKLPRLVIETYYVEHTDPDDQLKLQNKRRKRTIRFEFCPNTTQNCCLRELAVNFKRDLGWDFIILPEEIHINYCGGLCLVGTSQTPPQFEVLAGIHSPNYPCCSGASYEPVAMLIYDPDGMEQLLELSRLTVKSCKCG